MRSMIGVALTLVALGSVSAQGRRHDRRPEGQGRYDIEQACSDRAGVIALARRYGELDGDISWLYATHFAQVARTLTASQKQELRRLRDLDAYPCRSAYLYSEPIPMPEIPNTDVLFRAPSTH